jgi:hypothetical protein
MSLGVAYTTASAVETNRAWLGDSGPNLTIKTYFFKRLSVAKTVQN